jgi:uncharacterized membrane protein YgcG
MKQLEYYKENKMKTYLKNNSISLRKIKVKKIKKYDDYDDYISALASGAIIANIDFNSEMDSFDTSSSSDFSGGDGDFGGGGSSGDF